MSLERLVLATANPDKVAELVELLGDRFEVVGRPTDVADTIEDQPTLEGNARKKATEIAVATASPALSDDTGLFVDALDGRPGVFTARYAGVGATYDQNVDKLLSELSSAGASAGERGAGERGAGERGAGERGAGERRAGERGAEFRTCVALVWPDGSELIASGRVRGVIAAERRGSRGFGYDPVFAPVESDGRTFAEMSSVEKGMLSHRARALRSLLDLL